MKHFIFILFSITLFFISPQISAKDDGDFSKISEAEKSQKINKADPSTSWTIRSRGIGVSRRRIGRRHRVRRSGMSGMGQRGEGRRKPRRHFTKFEVDIVPLVYLNYKKTRKIVNLSLDCGEQCNKMINLEYQNDSSDGYRVEDYFNLDFGAGIATSFHFSNVSAAASLGGFSIGLMPIFSRSAKVVRYVDSRKSVDSLSKKLKLPYNALNVLDWNKGTVYNYQTSGGLLTFAGVGYTGISLGISYFVKGDWNVYIERLDKSDVFVKITKGVINEISGMGSLGGIFTVSAGKFKNSDDSFSFQINLDDTEGQKIYEDLVKGNLIPAEREVEESLTGIVTRVDHINRVSVGRKFTVNIGIPILSKKWEQGLIHTSAVQDLYQENEKYQIDLGTFYKMSAYSRVGKAVTETKKFVASSLRGEDGYEEQAGKFTWSFSTTEAWMPRVKKAFQKLYKLTGFKNELEVTFPEVKKLGYVGAEYSIYFSEEASNNLMNLSGEKKGFLSKIGSMMHNSYFMDNKDPENFCKTKVCKNRWFKKTKKVLIQAEKSLANMKMFKLAGDHKAFVKAYANFAKKILTNRFTLQAALNSVCGPVKIEYKLEGENFPYSTHDLSLKGNNCLVSNLK